MRKTKMAPKQSFMERIHKQSSPIPEEARTSINMSIEEIVSSISGSEEYYTDSNVSDFLESDSDQESVSEMDLELEKLKSSLRDPISLSGKVQRCLKESRRRATKNKSVAPLSNKVLESVISKYNKKHLKFYEETFSESFDENEYMLTKEYWKSLSEEMEFDGPPEIDPRLHATQSQYNEYIRVVELNGIKMQQLKSLWFVRRDLESIKEMFSAQKAVIKAYRKRSKQFIKSDANNVLELLKSNNKEIKEMLETLS